MLTIFQKIFFMQEIFVQCKLVWKLNYSTLYIVSLSFIIRSGFNQSYFAMYEASLGL